MSALIDNQTLPFSTKQFRFKCLGNFLSLIEKQPIYIEMYIYGTWKNHFFLSFCLVLTSRDYSKTSPYKSMLNQTFKAYKSEEEEQKKLNHFSLI